MRNNGWDVTVQECTHVRTMQNEAIRKKRGVVPPIAQEGCIANRRTAFCFCNIFCIYLHHTYSRLLRLPAAGDTCAAPGKGTGIEIGTAVVWGTPCGCCWPGIEGGCAVPAPAVSKFSFFPFLASSLAFLVSAIITCPPCSESNPGPVPWSDGLSGGGGSSSSSSTICILFKLLILILRQFNGLKAF